MPVLVVAEAKAVWMNFLTQSLLRSQIGNPNCSGIWNLAFVIQDSYSSVFFFLRKALLSFAAALLDFFCGFFSVGFSAASLFEPVRFARGAAAAPPRFARLLTAGFAATALPSVFAATSCLSLETRIVT